MPPNAIPSPYELLAIACAAGAIVLIVVLVTFLGIAQALGTPTDDTDPNDTHHKDGDEP